MFEFSNIDKYTLYGYGAGLTTALTLEEFPLNLKIIFDDNEHNWGHKLNGIDIRNIENEQEHA